MKQVEVVAGVITASGPDGKRRYFATQRGYGDFKDGWEFPGGKIEANETPEYALVRELREELNIEVIANEFICTVDYNYPNFHLKMHCYFCTIVKGELKLLEHESSRWLMRSELRDVAWLPADIEVVKLIESRIE